MTKITFEGDKLYSVGCKYEFTLTLEIGYQLSTLENKKIKNRGWKRFNTQRIFQKY